MFIIAQGETSQPQSFERQKVSAKEDPGIVLKTEKVIKHLQELRSLGYSILNELLLGNGRLAKDFITNRFAALPSLLLRDIMILPELLDNEESKNDQSCSEQLNDEGCKLLMNLMTIRELQPTFVKSGATLEFLTQLK